MVLNACAANGSVSLGRTVTILSETRSSASVFTRSFACGIYVTISFNRLMTPRLKRALPAMTGMVLTEAMPRRIPWMISSLVSSPESKYLSRRVSSFSAAVSINDSRMVCICAARFSGTGISSVPLWRNKNAFSRMAFTQPCIFPFSIIGS